MQLVFGPLGDRFGKIRVTAFAVLGCAAGNLAAATATGFGQMIAARVLSGAAAAAPVPLTMAWIGDKVPYGQRQEVLARLLGATVSGMIAGQWLGSVCADAASWRLIFVLLALVCLFAGARVMRAGDAAAEKACIAGGRRSPGAIEVLSISWPGRFSS